MTLFTRLQELNLLSSPSKAYDEQGSLQGWLYTTTIRKKLKFIDGLTVY